MTSMAKPVWCLDIKEVRNASEQGLPLAVPIAVVEEWKQRVTTIDLMNVSNIVETAEGYSFLANCYQVVVTLLHDYDDEKSYELGYRDSLCRVVVGPERIDMLFETSLRTDYMSTVPPKI